MRNPKLCRHFLELILKKKIKSISIPEYESVIERTRYYHDLIDLDLIEKGHSYKKLNYCIVLFICTFDQAVIKFVSVMIS